MPAAGWEFPVIASVEKREFIAPFQEAVRKDDPVLRPEQSRSVVLGPDGVRDARATTAWRFHDVRSDWRVTLAPDFLALETGRYTSRDDLLTRFSSVLHASEEHVDPKVIDRLGVRYIDRVTGAPLGWLEATLGLALRRPRLLLTSSNNENRHKPLRSQV